MAKLIYSSQALDDLQRLTDFLIENDLVAALETCDLIVEAISILRNHPLIGRPVESRLWELVISRGHNGYIALYSHEGDVNAVMVLAIRHQREAGLTDV